MPFLAVWLYKLANNGSQVTERVRITRKIQPCKRTGSTRMIINSKLDYCSPTARYIQPSIGSITPRHGLPHLHTPFFSAKTPSKHKMICPLFNAPEPPHPHLRPHLRRGCDIETPLLQELQTSIASIRKKRVLVTEQKPNKSLCTFVQYPGVKV
jgi:hypothetical protein